MPRYAQPVSAPAARTGAPSPAANRPANRAGPQRSAKWHAIQLQAARSAAPAPGPKTQSSAGLPSRLKAGVEHLSGIAMDAVRVHRNSPEPAKVGALAYAQGADIHLGPGQEKHLPHEAWHVVQQAQGRVRATMQSKTGVPVNDDASLEREADAMGARAAALPESSSGREQGETLRPAPSFATNVAQGEGMDVDTVGETIEDIFDDYHSEDDIKGNPEEELEPGDLDIPEIDSSQHNVLAQALAARHPFVYQEFAALAAHHRLTGNAVTFLNWFNAPVQTRSAFKAQFQKSQTSDPMQTKVMQCARGPGDSHQPLYQSTSHGPFKNVTYTRDAKGAIDFAKKKSATTWKNPVQSGSEVQLTKGSGVSTHGITLNGTKIKIAGASRGAHFSIANRIKNNGAGNTSPDGWTWHHLPTKYKMVLVDRMVHSKHGHNGGVHLWT